MEAGKETHVSERKRRNENGQNMEARVRLVRFTTKPKEVTFSYVLFVNMSHLFPLFAFFRM